MPYTKKLPKFAKLSFHFFENSKELWLIGKLYMNYVTRCSISLRKHPFLPALRYWGCFARNVPNGGERGETDVFAG